MLPDDNQSQPSANQSSNGEIKNYNLIRFGSKREFITSFVYDACMKVLAGGMIPETRGDRIINDIRWVESIADALEKTGNQSWDIELKQ